MIRSTRFFCFFLLCCCGALATAQGFRPSPEQIQQFQQLPPEQQRQLAESMGIDVDALISQQAPQASIGEPLDTNPRGRQQQSRQQQGGQQGGMGFSLPQAFSPVGSAISADELIALRKDYQELSEAEFDRLYEREYSHLTRRAFLETYQQITGREFNESHRLKPFGYDLFSLSPEAFAPPIDSPVPADYIMGPGDTLVVQLYGKENNNYNLTVSRDGEIQFPGIGPLNVAGLTFRETQELIANTVSEQMIGVRSSVTMGALRTIRVFVLGEATQPGSYTVSSLSTMTNALFISGGITKVGSLRNIQLKRKGEVVTTLDVYDLLLNGDTSKDARLLPGDAIFIPPVGTTVTVKGEVKRPAIYELKGEKTAENIIKLAGGFSRDAHAELTRVERTSDDGEKSLITLDLTTPKGQGFKVNNADTLEVASILEDVEDAITLKGHVKRPGNYAWREGLRFSDLIRSVDALRSNPDLDAALIKREIRNSRQTEIRVFSPKAAWSNPGGPEDPLLQERDTLFVFNYETDRTDALKDVLKDLQIQSRYQDRGKIVSVAGSVRFPGDYPLAEGMTAEELINLAGGLTESALGGEAELTRYDIDEDRTRVVVHIPVDLDGPENVLQPGDTLRVKQIPLWQEKETVEIAGEVLYPGTYSIRPGETLYQVLQRAGGLTDHAYANGAIFSRAELRRLERERLLDLRDKLEADLAATNVQDSSPAVSETEAQRLLSNLEEVKAVGRMVIDLPRIIERPSAYDFRLEDGDTLKIPRYAPSVTVLGEVQYPTSHFFDESLDVADYVGRSGGTKENADIKRIYVVKANGQVVLPERSAWFKRSAKNIDPGDTIIVPIDTDRVDTLALWGSVTQIMYQAALGIAAISSL